MLKPTPRLRHSLLELPGRSISPSITLGFSSAPSRMGTKHTSRGPNRRRRKVSAVRTFPPGCSPAGPNPPQPSDSASGPDEETPPMERGPVSDGIDSSEPPSKGESDGTEAAGAPEGSLPERRDLDSLRKPDSAIRHFPLGVGPNGSSKRVNLQSAAVSKAENLDGESIEEAECEAKSHEPNHTKIRAEEAAGKSATGDANKSSKEEHLQGATASKANNLYGESIKKVEATAKPSTAIGGTSGTKVSSGSTYDPKRALLEQHSQFGKMIADMRKRKLFDRPDQDVLDIKKQTCGGGSSQAPGKIVIVLGLMAARNCPWRNPKPRANKVQSAPRTKAK